MFQKLNRNFKVPLYRVISDLKNFTGEDGKGISYQDIYSPDADEFFAIIPQKYRQHFHLAIMHINARIPPHTDSNTLTTINCYIETSNCRTVFWDCDSEPVLSQIKNQTDGYLYSETDNTLRAVGEFRAKPSEIWVLDTKRIHSVEPDSSEPVKREVFTLSSDYYKYSDVIKMLEATNVL